MQKKKIFVEIDVPQPIKRRLSQKVSQWSQLPVKWMKEDNLHLTVTFIGYVDESVIPDICSKVNSAVENIEAFDLEMDRIEFIPDRQNPRLISLSGKPSEDLKRLHQLVEEALGMRPESHKEFSPHLTLGRLRKIKWDQLAEKPEVEEKVNIVIPVESVRVMESKGGGSEYVSLEECPLG